VSPADANAPIRPRDILGNNAVRVMVGRALRPDKKAINRNTLVRWRHSEGFPPPLKAPSAGVELWRRQDVREWLDDHGPRVSGWWEQRS
jgi:hypothetical protein